MKKKIILINTISIFLLSILFHFIYQWAPNFFTSIFFPVNESIWEHLKLLYTTIISFGIIQYFLYKKLYFEVNNFLSTLFLSTIINIIILLILYLPIQAIFGEVLILTMITLFISILITQIIIFPLYEQKENKALNLLCFLLIFICFGIFGYLSHNPLKNDLFWDKNQEKYGLMTTK